MKQQKVKLKSRIRSFKFAIQGLVVAFNGELNLRFHCIAALLVVSAAIYFDLPAIEWIALCFAIAFVITSELINTALEYLCDVVSPEQNPKIKKVKDIAAGAVLVATFIAQQSVC